MASIDNQAERDLYGILECPRSASTEEIKEKYHALLGALVTAKANSDSNISEIAGKLEELKESYDVLSDSLKRKEYDILIGNTLSPKDDEAFSPITSFRKAFGSIMHGLPPTMSISTPGTVGGSSSGAPLSTDIMETVSIMTQQGGISMDGPAMDPRIVDMQWGWGLDDSVARNSAHYFRLKSDRISEGFFIYCMSSTKGKFKLAVFDEKGALLSSESSVKCRDRPYTHASLFFTGFDTFSLASPTAGGSSSGAANAAFVDMNMVSSPKIFGKLRPFVASSLTATAGHYLVVVYGDNFMGKTPFHIVASPVDKDSPQCTLIQNADSSLIAMKGELEVLTEKYTKAKAEFEAAEQHVKEQGFKLDLLLDNRERAYREFIVSAITASAPEGSPSQLVFSSSPAATTVPSTGGTMSALKFLSPSSSSSSSSTMSAPGKMDKESSSDPEVLPEGEGGVEVTGEPTAADAANRAAAVVLPTVRAAAAGASAATERASSVVATAGGWLAKKLAVGVSQLQQIAKPTSRSDKSEEALDTPTPGGDEDTDQSFSSSTAVAKPAWPSIDESPVSYNETADISTDGLQGETTEPTFVSKLSPVSSSSSSAVVVPAGKVVSNDILEEESGTKTIQIEQQENAGQISNLVKVEQGHNSSNEEAKDLAVADLL